MRSFDQTAEGSPAVLVYVATLLLAVPADWALWGTACASFVPMLKMGDWQDYKGLYWSDKMALVRVPILVAIMFAAIAIGKHPSGSETPLSLVVVVLGIGWLAFALATHWWLLKHAERRP